MMLQVFIDFKSAGSLLALDPILELADRLGLELDWRPFRTAERDLPDSGASARIIDSHRNVREQSRRLIDQKYAELRGISLTYPKVKTETDLALGALAEITGDRLPFIRAAFAAYWEGHRDLDNEEVIVALLSSCGAEHSRDLDHTMAAFQTAQAQAETAGIVDAPGYILEGQIFIGRQHLPWIEEIALERPDRA